MPVEAFNYEEKVDGTDHNKYLWANAAWALGARLTHAFAQYGWCACIRGVESGGLVEGLPVHNFQHRRGRRRHEVPHRSADHRPAREGARRSRLHPAGALQGTPTTRRSSACSRRRKPRSTIRMPPTANARISAQLPYIFAVSRFAHYLKAMMRDKIGGYMSRSEAETFLNNWISELRGAQRRRLRCR